MSQPSFQRFAAGEGLEAPREGLEGQATVVLVERGSETVEAAGEAARRGVCRTILLGSGSSARLDPERDPRRLEMLDLMLRLPGGRRLGLREVEALVADPTWYAALMVAAGRADGAVGGSVTTSVAAARATLGLAASGPGVALGWLLDHRLAFGAPVAEDPTAEELAGAGAVMAAAMGPLLDDEPRLAFLSFSTRGSASHPRVEKVRRATAILAEGEPDFAFDGELQLDSALSAEVARRKAPDSPLGGRANLLVFPDLDSGKIAVELMQVLARSHAIGPMLLGPSRPVHPCPDGTAGEILDLMTVIAWQAKRGSA